MHTSSLSDLPLTTLGSRLVGPAWVFFLAPDDLDRIGDTAEEERALAIQFILAAHCEGPAWQYVCKAILSAARGYIDTLYRTHRVRPVLSHLPILEEYYNHLTNPELLANLGPRWIEYY